MAQSGKRQGSADRTSPVPHTRLEDEGMVEQVYAIGRILGQGSFGVVHEAKHMKTGKRLACKIINKEKAGRSAIVLMEREVAILKQVFHEHIIHLIEVFETPRKMYLVMEYCEGGELANLIKEKEHLLENDAKTIMKRLASAIAYLHKKAMVHRDLKPENILLSNNPADSLDTLYIKVTDFGLAVAKGGVSLDNMLDDFCGTPMCMAPEIIDNKTYSEKCDVWAMGVILFLMLSGVPPFQSNDEEQLYDLIKTADITKIFETKKIWKEISDEAKDCLCGMLNKNPAPRLTSLEVLDHPWITGAQSQRQPDVLALMREFHITENSSHNQSSAINGSQSNEEQKPDDVTDSQIRPKPSSAGATAKNTKQHSQASNHLYPPRTVKKSFSENSLLFNSKRNSSSVNNLGKGVANSTRPKSRSPTNGTTTKPKASASASNLSNMPSLRNNTPRTQAQPSRKKAR